MQSLQCLRRIEGDRNGGTSSRLWRRDCSDRREKGMAGAIAKAGELAEEIDGAVVLGQFINKANPAAHIRFYRTGDMGRYRR